MKARSIRAGSNPAGSRGARASIPGILFPSKSGSFFLENVRFSLANRRGILDTFEKYLTFLVCQTIIFAHYGVNIVWAYS